MPALVSGLRDDPLRAGSRVEVGQRPEPLDPREAVTALPPPLGIDEVLGEGLRVGLREAERPDPRQNLVGVQERTGNGLNVCFAASSACAMSRIARDASASGSAQTSGSP